MICLSPYHKTNGCAIECNGRLKYWFYSMSGIMV